LRLLSVDSVDLVLPSLSLCAAEIINKQSTVNSTDGYDTIQVWCHS